MPTDVQEVEKPAEVTGAEASPAPETSPAKETDQPKPEEKKEEQPKAKAESEEEEPNKPDKDNRIPWKWFERVKTKQQTAETTLNAFKDLGIESPEHAEILQRDSENLQYVVNQLEEDPESFESDLLKAYPEAHEKIAAKAITRQFTEDPAGFEKRLYEVDPNAHSRMMSNVVRRVLLKTAADYKQAGEVDSAEVLEKLALNYSQEAPRTKEPKREQQQNVPDDRWEYFEQQVASDVESRLTPKINEEITARNVQFRSEEKKQKFVDAVFDSLVKSLDRDTVFTRERDRIQNPAHGLTRDQRKQAADLTFKFATANGRLARIISAEIDDRNLPIKAKEAPPERKEANTTGVAPSGKLTKEESDKIYDKLYTQGLRGSDLTAAWMKAKRELRLGK